MELIESHNHEAATRVIKANMLSYYVDLGLQWNDEKKLEAYRRCRLWNIRADSNIGFAMTLEDRDEFYLAEIHIQEAHRNKGYGAQALAMVRDIAARMGHREIRIRVIKTSPALKLYERTGYSIEKELPYTYQLVAQTHNKLSQKDAVTGASS